VDSPTQEASKRARHSMANTILSDDHEIEAMSQCEKKAWQHEKVANNSNRSVRGSVNLLVQASKKARESVANTMPDN